MGEVVEVRAETKKLKVGDRVVVPFTIACGECFFCKRGFFSGCERSNPNHEIAEKVWGHSPAGLLDIPICLAVIAADKQNTFGCRTRDIAFPDQGSGRPDG